MFNKNTPKHKTRVSCVGRVSTRHGRLKSTLGHAILVGCGRCFTLKKWHSIYLLRPTLIPTIEPTRARSALTQKVSLSETEIIHVHLHLGFVHK